MIAATTPSPSARLAYVDERGEIVHTHRHALARFVRRHDVVIANDAATLPASLTATHERTGRSIEVRLAGRASLAPADMRVFTAVMFGEGDYRTRTEDRAPPPPMCVGDRLLIGQWTASIDALLDHPRLVRLCFDADAREVWRLLSTHGRAIQYAHVHKPLALWDVWTSVAAVPVAYEPPSAGFALDWSLLARLRAKGASFATLTHAAGISSTGDAALDRRLPFDEPYFIPETTCDAIDTAHTHGGRVIAVGTTVVRALEHSAARDGRVHAGAGLADQRLGPSSRLRVVDALLSGTHEAGTSHYELLRAFLSDQRLRNLTQQLDEQRYRTHEFGDSVLIALAHERRPLRVPGAAFSPPRIPLRNPVSSDVADSAA